MELKFFGNGSAFSQSHTSAYFECGNDLIIIDASLYNFKKMILLDLKKYDNVYVFITHMHTDHVSGLGMFIEYIYYVLNKFVRVVVDDLLMEDMINYLKLVGVVSYMYMIYSVNSLAKKDFHPQAIRVGHDPNLGNKCFAFRFFINGKKVVYSGDFNNLLSLSNSLVACDEFYCEMSTNPNVTVHLNFEKNKELLNALYSSGTKIYLMHVDDMERAKKLIEGTPFEIVPVI